MAASARPVLTAEQRDRIALILYDEIGLWVERFGEDLVRQVVDEVTGRASSTDPEPPPAASAVLPFARPASTSNAVASDD